ncbi:MAG TPA: hypothetical protein DHW02_17755 [Ktedonobacter sp.]|nr:hypothetical protein [Ktedonobacter sp.]
MHSRRDICYNIQESEPLNAQPKQSILSKIESFMQRIIEGPFARLFPSRLEPVEIERRLERAMEDNQLLQGEGRRLVPNVYDIHLSVKDHQQISSGQNLLIPDWQKQLVEFARHRHFTLRTVPVIRLHGDTQLVPGNTRIEAIFDDGQSGDGVMATQAISAEQLAQIRANMAASSQVNPNTGSQYAASGQSSFNAGGPSQAVPPQPAAPRMPFAQLVIRVPHGGQQTFRIEKPIINIGRQLSNDIIVEDKRVSRQHAQIKYQPDGSFAIYDLGSTNGITINGVANMRQGVLRNGDRFTIGNYDFFFDRR